MSRTTPHLQKIYVHDQARTSRETGCLSGSEVSLFTVITAHVSVAQNDLTKMQALEAL
jgi:hypothetical protein